MLTKLKIALAVAALSATVSACVKERTEVCGMWLEFVFDRNMEYADSFSEQVRTVDVFLFDAGGLFVRRIHAATDELTDRRRMFIDRPEVGKYRVLAVGNLAAPFSFATAGGGSPTPGVTTIEQVRLALDTARASAGFDHLYFGSPAAEVAYDRDQTWWRVPLVRETNRFDVRLQSTGEEIPADAKSGPVEPTLTVEIAAPERGTYNHLNAPVDRAPLSYKPYELLSRVERNDKGVWQETSARLNTMRLLADEKGGYRLNIRDIATDTELWSCDLLALVAGAKEAKRPDGTPLPLAEYLDRECDWKIVIAYRDGSATRISVNGWIVWQTGMDV